MLQLDNASPFAASMFAFPDEDGVQSIFVAVKGTFAIGESGPSIAEEQRPVVVADEHWGEPGASSVKYASEAHIDKLGTDVVIVGEACAPGERPVPHVDVSVRVADRSKGARVYGERYWTERVGGVRPSKPTPMVRIPVTYERTFGGTHVVDPSTGRYLAEPRNPVGRGFSGKRSLDQFLGQPTPNIEALDSPLRGPSNKGTPVGFGPIAPSWEPRMRYAGTYDEVWRKTRAPYLPQDFDRRFLNIAPPELQFIHSLRGGEPISLTNFHPRGRQTFTVPKCELSITVTLAGTPHVLPYRLETVVLEPTDEVFSLCWRASRRVDKQLLRVEKIGVELLRAEGVDDPRGRA